MKSQSQFKNEPLISPKKHFTLIFLFLWSFTNFTQLSWSKTPPQIKDGVLDISNWDFEKDGTLKIQGKVPFYWKKLLDPNVIAKEGMPPTDTKFNIPGLWDAEKSILKSKKSIQNGYGSYLFKIIGSKKSSQELGFELSAFSTAYKIYKIQDGKVQKLNSAGEVGESPSTGIPTFKKVIEHFNSRPGEYFILIHASNFHYRSGGFFEPIVLGHYKKLKINFEKLIIKDFLSMGILFIMALYHFGLFLLRREDLGSFWFGSFCSIQFIRLGITPLSYLLQYSGMSTSLFIFSAKLEYLTIVVPAPIFLMFLRTLFKEQIPSIFAKVFSYLAVFLSSFILLTGPSLFTRPFFLIFTNVMIFILAIYVLFVLFKAVSHKIPNSKACLLGCFVFFFGVVFDILIALNLIPKFLPMISPITFIAFIFIQSYILAGKFSQAYKTAERLSKDLQKEVELQTKVAVDQKNRALESEKEVSNLLHNMRQAVFTIDYSLRISPPVSEFSKEIFGENIEGKLIFDNIFKQFEPKSEEYSVLLTSLTVIFDSDELQWDLMKEYYPTRIIYRLNKEAEEKILKLSFTPLFNDEDLLKKLMFIIEDVTEIERLEREMKDQKSEVSKKGQIIQELASNKKEELQAFFHDNNKLSKDAIDIWRKARRDKKEGKPIEKMDELFRNLHTIKGNSRIFGLSHISTKTHEIENKADVFKGKGTEERSFEDFDDYMQDLYELQGQINTYSLVAKEIFNIESEDDAKFKLELHEGLKEVEFWLSQISILGHKKKGDTFVDEVNNLDNDVKDQIFSSLKRDLHTLKGLARAMGQKEFTQNIHLLEESLLDILNRGVIPSGNIEDQWLNPLLLVKDIGRNLYFNSSLFRPLNLGEEGWRDLMDDFFHIVFIQINSPLEDRKHLLKKLYSFNSKSMGHRLFFIPLVIRSIYELFEKDSSKSKEIIDNHLKKIWHFFKLLIQLDLEKHIFAPIRDTLVGHLKKYSPGDEWDNLLKELYRISEISHDPLLIQLFKKWMGSNQTYENFIRTLNFLENKKEKSLEGLIPVDDCLDYLGEGLACLKEIFNLNSFRRVTFSNDKKLGTIETITDFIVQNKTSPFNYIESIDFMALLSHYVELDDDLDKQMKPDVIEVLQENFLDFKSSFKKMVGKELILPWNQTELLIDSLTFQPVKYSLRNLKNMADDISKGIGKKIKFSIKGDQGSLEKSQLTLLKDATVHLIRNSIDHGIESPNVRVERGKSEFGSIEIQCFHDPKEIFKIEIKDDGAGIDPEKICQKAIEKGIISNEEGQKMTVQEKVNLIFLPSFSTKNDVTELSGRGVGMDVVKSNLKKIGATLHLDSIHGKGTHFLITFPNRN